MRNFYTYNLLLKVCIIADFTESRFCFLSLRAQAKPRILFAE
ncbi:hypothetical protein HFN_1501 [Helicobacter fennelliae MRY12-0050]|uniref:Uncharacterized protein n=1 Tax=Helicobacter fennelliae MRY12-0050 TaxID=1325130 RepID=T1DUU7_9HELI|nr:hypothetical protein HFN_1501 [Helicobacter fennelliae MRY12-0050]